MEDEDESTSRDVLFLCPLKELPFSLFFLFNSSLTVDKRPSERIVFAMD